MDNFYLVDKFDPAVPGFVTRSLLYLAQKKSCDDEASDKVYDVKFRKELSLALSSPEIFTHENIWGFPYHVKFDGGNIDIYWFEYKTGEEETHYQRYIYYDLKNVCYKTDDDGDKWFPVDSVWGNQKVIYFKDNRLITLYGLPEISFSNEAEMKEDFMHHKHPSLTPLCNEIFGDG